jgi:4-carboxymuconolactone decarboxylase
MAEDERYRRGASVRRKILGHAWVDRAEANRNTFNAEWQDFITRCAWGEVWTRPHFDERTRRVLVIGTMMAIGRWEEFRMHVRAALLEGGFSPEDVKEIILQQAIYVRRAGRQSRLPRGRRVARGASRRGWWRQILTTLPARRGIRAASFPSACGRSGRNARGRRRRDRTRSRGSAGW